jgi:hypothetical protein
VGTVFSGERGAVVGSMRIASGEVKSRQFGGALCPGALASGLLPWRSARTSSRRRRRQPARKLRVPCCACALHPERLQRAPWTSCSESSVDLCRSHPAGSVYPVLPTRSPLGGLAGERVGSPTALLRSETARANRASPEQTTANSLDLAPVGSSQPEQLSHCASLGASS